MAGIIKLFITEYSESYSPFRRYTVQHLLQILKIKLYELN